MTETIIPSIVQLRWTEALENESMFRWRSLSQMCASMARHGNLYTPYSEVVMNLHTLAAVAHAHQILMQPMQEAA
jgi:hypothetical protein